MLQELLNALEETLFMVFASGLLTWIIGLPLGALLAVTGKEKFLANSYIYNTLNFLFNTARSLPFIALMIGVIPFTHFVVGNVDGCIAAVLPLTLAAVPTFAQLCQKSIQKVPVGLIEAARAAGASSLQIIYKILIPEALPNIIKGLTITLNQLVGYSTIAGALGAGGLGEIIIEKGYQVFHLDYVLITLVLLIALMQVIQSCGNYIAYGNFHQHTS